MTILIGDLKLFGSAVMPDDDTTLAIGGAINLTRKSEFADLIVNGLIQAVSSNSGDTTQSITVHYKNIAGLLASESKTLTGLTPIAFAATMRTLMKAIKSATTAGDIAVEAVTAERTGTAQGSGGGTNTIQLDTGASAVDGTYDGMVIRITAGAGSGQIRQIKRSRGADKIAFVNGIWTTAVDITSVFRISRGMVFEKSPSEIFEPRRAFYNVAADDAFGADRIFFEKLFLKNTHATDSLSSAQVQEFLDALNQFTFGLAATLDDTGTNGAGNNRQVAPAAITFDSNAKTIPGGVLAAGVAIGLWLKHSAPKGDSAVKSSYTPQGSGTGPA
jgi:hypothetical protein